MPPQAEISQIRDDVAPSWLREPLTREETAERYVRPALRGAFLDLVSRPAAEYVARFGFKSDLLKVGLLWGGRGTGCFLAFCGLVRWRLC